MESISIFVNSSNICSQPELFAKNQNCTVSVPLITPHVAYNTPAALNEMCHSTVDNLVAFYAGKPQNVATS